MLVQLNSARMLFRLQTYYYSNKDRIIEECSCHQNDCIKICQIRETFLLDIWTYNTNRDQLLLTLLLGLGVLPGYFGFGTAVCPLMMNI
jgi:hypothetical protein